MIVDVFMCMFMCMFWIVWKEIRFFSKFNYWNYVYIDCNFVDLVICECYVSDLLNSTWIY